MQTDQEKLKRIRFLVSSLNICVCGLTVHNKQYLNIIKEIRIILNEQD